jgi:1,4-dihydroxy-2-naphthoate octaprenyltransferase
MQLLCFLFGKVEKILAVHPTLSTFALNMNETNIKQDSPRAWLLAARPKTLSGAAVPVMIGVTLAWVDAPEYGDGVFSWTAAILCLLFAFIMQVDANFINDFFDYVRGNDDAATRLGPLRACTQGWVKADSMKRAIATTTVVACLVGLPLIYYGGLEMVLIGILCVVFCFLYTTHLSYVGMGDVLVLLFFGIVPVTMTYYVQLHTVTPQVLAASVACGLVIDGLLVVNNYRDRDNDLADGKRTLVVAIGAGASEQLYLGLGIAAVMLGTAFWMNGHPIATLLPLLYLVLHVYTWLKMKRINHGRKLNTCLGETARNILVYGICVVLGLLLV